MSEERESAKEGEYFERENSKVLVEDDPYTWVIDWKDLKSCDLPVLMDVEKSTGESSSAIVVYNPEPEQMVELPDDRLDVVTAGVDDT